jgi:hypothetical protein
MDGPVRTALLAVATAFVVFFTCVFVFMFDPSRSILGVPAIGIPLGLVVTGVMWLIRELTGGNLPA